MTLRYDPVETLRGYGTVTTPPYDDEFQVRYEIRVSAGMQRFAPPTGTKWLPTGGMRRTVVLDHDQQLRSTTARPLSALVLRLNDERRLNLTVTRTGNGGLVTDVIAQGDFLPPE